VTHPLDRQYDAVIFDLFGTLVDFSAPGVWQAHVSRMAAVLGISADQLTEAWQATVTPRHAGLYGSLEGYLLSLGSMVGCDLSEGQVAEATTLHLDFLLGALQPRTDAVATLNTLREQRLRLGLISNADFDVPAVWDQTPLAPLFEVAVFSCEVGLCKPAAEIYALTCERLGVDPARCLYVGDGSSDELSGAKATGMTAVLIKAGYDAEFDSWRPEVASWTGPVITSLAEVPAQLGGASPAI
jgi:putative hydrolase of the HAD superfamily